MSFTINNEEFEILLALIFEHIEVIPESDYNNCIDECQDVIDEDDIPILAVAIACKVDGIWTHDPHFKKQERIKVFTNIDLLKQS